MRFSVMIWPHSGQAIESVARLARCAEDCGFETVYVGDSQMLWNDVYICLACCAQATQRVKLGPGVTNPVTRHPAVTANAITSLNMLSNGRAILGIGAGDSAVRTAGLTPAKAVQLHEQVLLIRALLTGEEVDAPRTTEGEEKKTWGRVSRLCLSGAKTWGNVPIQIAVMSPKAATMAAEIADGVIVDGHMGGNAEGAAATIVAASEGARRAGKDPSTLRFIAAIDAAIDDDRTRALDKVRPTAARNIAGKLWLPKTLGVEHADVVAQVTKSYRFSQHLDLTASHRQLIPDEVAQKCTIAGTPQDCITKARELQAAGMTDIAIFVTTQDEAGARMTLERFAREVIPYV
jgi:5,10-methylenetetrahydromethanopterin reductase